MSLVTPQRLYVAAHNRPVFVVRRLDNNDIMVVSDINAALGLFPQVLIQDTRAELDELKRQKQRDLKQARSQGRGRSYQREISRRYEKDKADLLERFRVSVTPFDKESLVGVIETKVCHNKIHRSIRITDFSGQPVPDLDSFETILNPEQVRKKALQTFYETHFHEIPDRLRQALDSHLPADDADPLLPVRERHLYRRFGRRLEMLRRVVIVGMGSSYHVGLMARACFRRLLPGVHCTVIRPVEVEHVPWSFAAQGDLVILISVSGTSADMVELARILLRERVTMIALTEKPFADMALIAQKSAGVIPLSAGEEVTYTAVKTTPCSLLAAHLLAVWLNRRMARQDEADRQVAELQRLPDRIERLIRDPGTRIAAETIAQMGRNSSASIVIDDLAGRAVGREIAMKLEENSWDAPAKWLDYADIPTAVLHKTNSDYFVLVNATQRACFEEARDVMKALYLGRVPFAALSTDHAHREEIQFYSQGKAFFLPEAEQHFQPFLDLPFAYILAACYGIVHDRYEPGFPRNRAKSVTVSRSRPEKVRAPLDGVVFGRLPETDSSDTVVAHLEGPSLWEQHAVSPWERDRYRAMRELAQELSRGDWLEALTHARTEQAESDILCHLAEACDEGQIIFAATDRAALATARGLASLWRRLVDGLVEATPLDAVSDASSENDLLLVLSTDPEAAARVINNWRDVNVPAAWLGPALEDREAQRFQQGAGYFPIRARRLPVAQEALYVLVNLFMIEAAKKRSPRQGLLLETTFRWVPRVVEAILNDLGLHRQIEQAAEDNRVYHSGAFYGSSRGDGLAWSVRFDQAGSLALQPYFYGEESYGPIVTVDPNVRTKFIELRAREEMVAEFGCDQVTRWENRFLGCLDIDVFLSRPELLELSKGSRPCYVDGVWVLPVLSPRYDARQDNLIFIDATSPRNVNQAMDTLAVHGCRYARMILIKQKGVGENQEDKGLFRYPISQALELPSLEGHGDRQNIPELLLPFAMNLIGTAMAASFAKAKGIEIVPVTTSSLLKKAFGVLGEALVENRIGVRPMNQFIIEELQALDPLIQSVEGVFRYRVEEAADESHLRGLSDAGLLGAAEQIMEAYEAHADDGYPFYLIYPDQDNLQDNIFGPAATGEPGAFQHKWQGAFGTSWQALYFKKLEMSEDPNRGPRVELPVWDVSTGTGHLYHLFIRYKPWDHQRSLDEESDRTAKALGRGVITGRFAASRYGVIIGLFVEEPGVGGLAWNDRWLTLVPRHWLFSKPTREIASLLLKRTRSLGEVLARRDEGSISEQLSRALEDVWPELGASELLPDNERWQRVQTAVVQSIKGLRE